MVTKHFDLIIIGTGSGNSILSPALDSWSIAIVEEGVFGGTCLNRGCIPTKMFVHAADVAETVRHASHLGIDAHVEDVRWRDIRDRVFNRIDPISAGGEEYRTHRCPNVTVFKGRGTFVGTHTIAVNGEEITGTRIVVAAGARPYYPEITGLDAVPFHTSDDIMRVDELPTHLIVIGGGYIANELAHVFGSFGTHVTLVHRGDRLLKEQDEEISLAFTEAVRARDRFTLRLHVTPVSVLKKGDDIHLTLSDGSVVVGDALLLATGRIPNSDNVGAAAAGLALHPDGRIVVDEYQRTSVEGVWALGDISSPHMLKHVANHEARVVARNLARPEAPTRTNHAFVPAAVFTRPQIASVGLTERAARAQGIDVVMKTQRFGDVAYGWAMEDTTGFCKLIADRETRRLVGAHLMGPQASTLIQQLIQGMRAGQSVDEMAHDQYYIHPALPEVIENALLGLQFD
jgi:mycothione reductase